MVLPMLVLVHWFPSIASQRLRHRPGARAPAWERGMHWAEASLWWVLGGKEVEEPPLRRSRRGPRAPAADGPFRLMVWRFLLSIMCFFGALLASAGLVSGKLA